MTAVPIPQFPGRWELIYNKRHIKKKNKLQFQPTQMSSSPSTCAWNPAAITRFPTSSFLRIDNKRSAVNTFTFCLQEQNWMEKAKTLSQFFAAKQEIQTLSTLLNGKETFAPMSVLTRLLTLQIIFLQVFMWKDSLKGICGCKGQDYSHLCLIPLIKLSPVSRAVLGIMRITEPKYQR